MLSNGRARYSGRLLKFTAASPCLHLCSMVPESQSFSLETCTAGAENGREEGSARNPVTEAAAEVSEGVGLKMLRLKDDHLTRQ